MAALTPMMQQYVEVKEKYKDCILFYRIGDFYEMFFEDAVTASKVLEITLTGKDCGQEERAPMCGVPYHACDVYLNKLIENGFIIRVIGCKNRYAVAGAYFRGNRQIYCKRAGNILLRHRGVRAIGRYFGGKHNYSRDLRR